MQIIHKIDDFLYTIFPKIKGGGNELVISALERFYTFGPFKPIVTIDKEWVTIDIDATAIVSQEADYRKVIALSEKGKYTEAKPILLKLIDQNPSISEYHRIMGQILSEEGDQDQADTGQGILQALQSNPNYEHITEEEALSLCIKRGVSAGKGLGFGLFATSEFIRLNQGDILVYSGTHYLKNMHNGYEVFQGPLWNGTIVYLRINTQVPVDYKQIMPESHALPDDYQEFVEKHFEGQNELW